MRKKTAVEHESSSGNIFADVGLPDDYLAKAELVAEIEEIIAKRGITQAEAANVLGIDQPRVSALLRGKLSLFSLERLMAFVRRLGNNVEINIVPTATQPSLVVFRPKASAHHQKAFAYALEVPAKPYAYGYAAAYQESVATGVSEISVDGRFASSLFLPAVARDEEALYAHV